jgi:hypothetical protein
VSFKLSVIMASVVKFVVIVISVVKLSVVMVNVSYAECHYS